MSDDVTIPREMAKRYAEMLREAFHGMGGAAPLSMVGLADLLDPTATPTCEWESCETPTPVCPRCFQATSVTGRCGCDE